MLTWMYWTPEVAIFFGCIVVMLAGMTVWEIRSPTVERKGFLPIAHHAWRPALYRTADCRVHQSRVDRHQRGKRERVARFRGIDARAADRHVERMNSVAS